MSQVPSAVVHLLRALSTSFSSIFNRFSRATRFPIQWIHWLLPLCQWLPSAFGIGLESPIFVAQLVLIPFSACNFCPDSIRLVLATIITSNAKLGLYVALITDIES
jgi:hypothetical protein